MIVLDSSFLIAYKNASDVHHAEAARIMAPLAEGRWGPALLPEYVFLEVVTVLAARKDHRTAVETARTLLAAREVEFVPASAHFLDTLEAFETHGARGLSFADAAIVILARERGATHVATFDRRLLEVSRLQMPQA